ncbi:MAG: toprim domain-containing protein [Dinoroseobacter sp.]|nr:toprim domain-containing protein [Dinoroseobacter sp.]
MNAIDPAQLTHDLGGKWYGSYGTAPCPICQPERRRDQTALGIRNDGERLLMNCKKSSCDFRDLLVASGIASGNVEIDPCALEKAERDRKADDAKKLERARCLWGSSQPLAGTKGEQYLRSRGITCNLPDTLRWLPDAYHQPSGRYCSAMVANVSSGGVHRTFFTKTGNRLSNNAKMMLGPCRGGAVRLSETLGPLVVCEGIETGLSLLSGLLSEPATVWAALSTSGMKGLRLPERPGNLVVATDGDPEGRAAGNDLAARAHGLGWTVSLLPAPDGQDWNDVLRKQEVAV